jgi:salicylate hydroxylase
MLKSATVQLDRMSSPSSTSAWIAGASDATTALCALCPAMTSDLGEGNRMPRAPRIVIVGGGIGGLAAALALEARGAEVIVAEQSPVHSEIGAGLNLTPNAVKAFRALGLDQAIEDIGWASEFQLIRSWRSGRYISRIRRSDFRQKFGAPNLTVHRADLLELLRNALKTTEIRLGKRCTGVDAGERVAVARFADGGEIEADIVVGADGIHSVVREALFGADAPRFTGCICWRGMAPVDAVPRDINTADGTMWMGPHGHVVHYRVHRGELLNIVAHIDSDAWTEESWTRECDLTEVTAAYERWHRDLTRIYPCSTRWYKWALYDRDPLQRWRKGRATLLGDSAHAMLPYLGQGAGMAVEDGCVLAAMVARHGDDLGAALTAYERTRAPRATMAVLGSRARAKENHLASPWARLKRDVKFKLRERFGANRSDNTAFQVGWLYGYDVAKEAG